MELSVEQLDKIRSSSSIPASTLERMEYIISQIYFAVGNEQPVKLKAIEPSVQRLQQDYSSGNNTLVKEFAEAARNIVTVYPEAKALQLKRMELASNMMWDIKGSSDVGLDKVTAMGESTNEIIKREKLVMSLSILFVIILGAGLVYLLTTTITRPIKKGIEMANALADGDLTHMIEITEKMK
ncbi:MAG: hypothetical protein HC905_30060 [Bacteroidales bacterium]|nr:hypothetical protein [Bacteroidales bacterium]